MAHKQLISVIVNRRRSNLHNSRYFSSVGNTETCTALNAAVHGGFKEIVSQLVEHGAALDVFDCSGFPLIANAGTSQVAEHLLRLGASPSGFLSALCIHSVQWFRLDESQDRTLSLLFGEGPGMPEWKLDWLIDARSLGQARGTTFCNKILVSTTNIRELEKLQFGFTDEDFGGRSLMHCIICSAASAGFVLGKLSLLERTTPFPWHLAWYEFRTLAFLTTTFSILRRALPHETFHRILNLEPQRGPSPLCRAASLNLVDIMENCLSMGAVINFEGSCLGSALILASACENLEAVKCLVNHGAAISYTGEGGFRSAFTVTRSEKVRQWLLVGRYQERLRISETCFWDLAHLRPWSGVVQAGVRLVGRLGRRPDETSITYIKRLHQWKKVGRVFYKIHPEIARIEGGEIRYGNQDSWKGGILLIM